MSELVGRTDDKRVEGVFRIQRVVDGLKIQTSLRGQFRLCRGLLDHVHHVDVSNICRSGGIKNNVDMFIEPISEEGVRNANIKSSVVLADELRGFEPGVVALLIYFFFNFIENFLPGIHETANM